MEKNKVNEYEYIAAMNEELVKHPLYESGMEIIGVSEGYSGADLSGYNYKVPSSLMPGIVHEISTKIDQKYVLVN